MASVKKIFSYLNSEGTVGLLWPFYNVTQNSMAQVKNKRYLRQIKYILFVVVDGCNIWHILPLAMTVLYLSSSVSVVINIIKLSSYQIQRNVSTYTTYTNSELETWLKLTNKQYSHRFMQIYNNWPYFDGNFRIIIIYYIPVFTERVHEGNITYTYYVIKIFMW